MEIHPISCCRYRIRHYLPHHRLSSQLSYVEDQDLVLRSLRHRLLQYASVSPLPLPLLTLNSSGSHRLRRSGLRSQPNRLLRPLRNPSLLHPPPTRLLRRLNLHDPSADHPRSRRGPPLDHQAPNRDTDLRHRRLPLDRCPGHNFWHDFTR